MGDNGLQKSLTFSDLMAFGVAAIMGSGGFNLIGDGILKGGSQFPIALGGVAALFQGASRTYQEAYNKFKSNTAESDIIKEQFGDITANISSISILFFNILSISTILVISAKMMMPSGSWFGQVGIALTILIGMTGFSLQGIELNKEVVSFFGYTILSLLSLTSLVGIIDVANTGVPTDLPYTLKKSVSAADFTKSFLYFYFILAGFDALIKFTEEAKDPDNDIPRSFFASNALAVILTVGVCFSFLAAHSLGEFHEDENIVARIIGSMFGSTAGKFTGIFSILLMIVTSFVTFLATTRYMYGLGKAIPMLKPFTELNTEKVPINAVFATFIIGALGILINHVYTLVKVSDIALTVTLLLVSAAATSSVASRGEVPLIEGSTTLGFLGLLGISLYG